MAGPYPTLGTTELSAFSGRPAASYPTSYPDQAIRQAMLLFKIATGLGDNMFPDAGTTGYDLAVNGILSLADMFILEQPYQDAKASPFNSESIGSYSYSKVGGRSLARAVSTIASDGKTGDIWFDLAVEMLGIVVNAVNMPAYGGIEVFEFDAPLVHGAGRNLRMLGPSDQKLMRFYGLDPVTGQRSGYAYANFSPAVEMNEELPWVEDPPGSGLFVPPWEVGQ